MRVKILTLVCLLGICVAASRAGDDTVFSLVVSREYRAIYGVAIDYDIYVNDISVGSVSNGETLRYAIPANREDGKYRVKVASFGSSVTGGEAGQEFVAAPGANVTMEVGLDLGWFRNSFIIRNLKVDQLAGTGKLHVLSPPGGLNLSILGPKNQEQIFRIDTSEAMISTIEQTTKKRFIRLSGAASHPDWKSTRRFVIFASPSQDFIVDFATPGGRHSILASVNYIVQMRACVLHHIGAKREEVDLGPIIDSMEADLDAIPMNGVCQEVLDLKSKYVGYFRDIHKLSQKGVLGPLVGGLLVSGLSISAEAYFSGTTVTAEKVLSETIPDIVEAAYSKFQASAALVKLGKDFDSAETDVIALLRRDLPNHIFPRRYPLIQNFFGGGVELNSAQEESAVEAADRFAAAAVEVRAATLAEEEAASRNRKHLDCLSHYQQGRVAFAKNELRSAYDEYSQAISLDPEYGPAYSNRGLIMLTIKRYDLAVDEFTAALDHDPRNAIIYGNRGQALFYSKQYDKALEDYNISLSLNPNSVPNVHGRGLVWWYKGDFARAEADFKTALLIDPTYAPAVKSLERVLQAK